MRSSRYFVGAELPNTPCPVWAKGDYGTRKEAEATVRQLSATTNGLFSYTITKTQHFHSMFLVKQVQN